MKAIFHPKRSRSLTPRWQGKYMMKTVHSAKRYITHTFKGGCRTHRNGHRLEYIGVEKRRREDVEKIWIPKSLELKVRKVRGLLEYPPLFMVLIVPPSLKVHQRSRSDGVPRFNQEAFPLHVYPCLFLYSTIPFLIHRDVTETFV